MNSSGYLYYGHTAFDALQGRYLNLTRGGPPRDFEERYRPLFIIGCGRSGTTILGRTLSAHRGVRYLNEPLHLWFACFPNADIWSPFTLFGNGRIAFDAGDVGRRERLRAHAIFDRALGHSDGVFVEKTPINTFRIGMIAALFPSARYLYIRRDPLSVAESIRQCMVRDGTWWGFAHSKWRALQAFAQACPAYARFAAMASGDFERGLLEWRMSHDAALEDLARLPSERVLSIEYGDFAEQPAATMRAVLDFVALPACPDLDAFLAAQIRSRPRDAEARERLEETALQPRLLERAREFVGPHWDAFYRALPLAA